MNDAWKQIITSCVPILCLLITAGGAYLVALLKKETINIEEQLKNDTVAKYINMANDAVQSAVIYTTQTFVETLKKNGGFTKERQIEAFNKSKEKALEILGKTAIDALNEIYGDLDVWLTAKIEQVCWETKKPVEQIKSQ